MPMLNLVLNAMLMILPFGEGTVQFSIFILFWGGGSAAEL